MAVRKALVFGADGLPQQIQAADTLNTNAKFTGTLAIPGTLLGGSSNAVLTVTPAIAGDALAVGEAVVLQALATLPTGLNIAYWVVSSTNQVTVYFTSNALITAGSNVAFVVVAQR